MTPPTTAGNWVPHRAFPPSEEAMKIFNTRKQPDGPGEEDVEELRRLIEEALKNPDGFVIVSVPIEIDADGNIILRKGN